METATVTCHTSGCAVAGVAVEGVPITADSPEGENVRVGIVICGVCGQEITDIVEEDS